MTGKAKPMNRQSQADVAGYLAWLGAGGRSATTTVLRRSQLNRLAEAYPLVPLRSLTTHDLVVYLAGQSHFSSATAYSFRATLIDFYGWLVQAGRLKTNPASSTPRIRVRNRLTTTAPEEAVLDRDDLDERTRLMVDLGGRQGLRRNEIACIHSRDLVRDGEHGWALIVHGKGQKDRLVPLHSDIAARIVAAGPGWLFPSPSARSATGHLSANFVGAVIRAALPDGVTTHSLRRRFATVCYDGAHDVRSVQLLLGHASLDTTQRYIGVRPQDLREALAHS